MLLQNVLISMFKTLKCSMKLFIKQLTINNFSKIMSKICKNFKPILKAGKKELFFSMNKKRIMSKNFCQIILEQQNIRSSLSCPLVYCINF